MHVGNTVTLASSIIYDCVRIIIVDENGMMSIPKNNIIIIIMDE
jgi:hypothetical protein